MVKNAPWRRPGLLLAALVGLGFVVSLALLGGFAVGEDEVVVVRRGGSLEVYEAGRHWRLPLVGNALRLPRTPVSATREVAITTAEGATLTLEVTGSFAVRRGEESTWIAASGWAPFLDGVLGRAETALSHAVAEVPSGSLLGAATVTKLTAAVRDDLSSVGITVAGLSVDVPVAKNPALAALARTEVEKLAEGDREKRRKVLMVGWDAADWLIIRPLIEAGRLPNLARIVAHGSSGDLRSQKPILSPLVWTTIATGRTVPEHGIADFLVLDPESGAKVPIASTARKTHALWTILTALGMESDVIGYWATWPAEPILGHMVTDRVAYQLFGYDAGASAEGKVYPPEYWSRVKELTVSAEEIELQDVRRFVDVTEAEFQQAWDSLPPERRQENKINHLRKILAATRTYEAIALDLLSAQTDLTIAYFEGTDTIGHLFGRYLPPRMPMVSEQEVVKYGRAIREFYVYADEILGRLVAAASDDTVVMVLSDHGFYTGELRPESDPADFTTGAPQWHRMQGIIAAAGPGIRRSSISNAGILDVTPTVLAILGLPVPKDLGGKVLREIVPADLQPSIGTLASYEALPRVQPERIARSAAEDRERMRELVALGYISPGALNEGQDDGGVATAAGGDAPAGSPAGPPLAEAGGVASLPAPTTAPPNGMLPTQKINLAQGFLNEGKVAEARRLAVETIAEAPGFTAGYMLLAVIAQREGDLRGQVDALAQALMRGQDVEPGLMADMVDLARRIGRLDTASNVLERLRTRFGTTPEYSSAWGALERARGDLPAALKHFERALELGPTNLQALDGKIKALRGIGRDGEARDALAARLAAPPGTVNEANSLAAIALDQGWPQLAEPLLRKVLVNDPGHVGVLLNMGVCLAQQGRPREAEEYLRRLVVIEPDNPTALFNLGFIAGEQQRFQEALAYFDRAERAGLVSGALHVARARALFFLGDRARTESELRRALTLEPGNQEARRLLALLTQSAGAPSGGR